MHAINIGLYLREVGVENGSLMLVEWGGVPYMSSVCARSIMCSTNK
jgi:hypothetical protein